MKIVGLLALLGLWMLVAGGSEATPVHINLNYRPQVYRPTENVYEQASETYIVIMGTPRDSGVTSHDEISARSMYTQLLQSVKQGSSTLDWNGDSSATAVLHVYSYVCNGFSAQLTPQEAAMLSNMDVVQAVYPDKMYSVHTTYTPKYLGLSPKRGLLREGHLGDDMIIGVIDTGVWPERDSFKDDGLGPIPARWKGICQEGHEFNTSNCNRKLIGARYYVAGYERALLNATGKPLNETLEPRSPRDYEGHGSHTSSTAAGSASPNASLFGTARGTARGMAPKARIAVYKVCWLQGCFGSDVLAGMDQAVADGVDILSLSLGDDNPSPYFLDPIAIGGFGAMKKGIFVSCSAGNNGPNLQTVSNFAPWLMTVAASTVDRTFPANVKLGDGQVVMGQSFNQLGGQKSAKLITGADAGAASSNATMAALCMPGSLDPALVKGKIVVCTRGINARLQKSFVVFTAGGAGMILANTPADGEAVIPDAHFVPASHVGAKAASIVLSYIQSAPNPVAKFQFLSQKFGAKPAPSVSSFSSRGPNPVTPEILKPDVTGPGVFILAAWTGRTGEVNVSPSGLAIDTRQVEYNIISGTSMSCPHITGLAALLKATYPKWSPAAIKSAMMTTATTFDNTGEMIRDAVFPLNGTTSPGNPFLFGSGQVRPEKALDPGLVYDLRPHDYVNFLCTLNYSRADIQNLYGDSTFRCPEIPVPVEDFNYPSFSAVFRQPPSEIPVSINMTRTVTYVRNKAYGCTTYKANILAPLGIQISVEPNVLRFCARDQKKTFILRVTTINAPNPALANLTEVDFAFLQWTDGTHQVVQSPISVLLQK